MCLAGACRTRWDRKLTTMSRDAQPTMVAMLQGAWLIAKDHHPLLKTYQRRPRGAFDLQLFDCGLWLFLSLLLNAVANTPSFPDIITIHDPEVY